MSKALKEEVKEETSILDELLTIDSLQQTEELGELKVSEPKKRSQYVIIRHNASNNYNDKDKAAELGVDLYPGGFSRDMELSAIVRGNKNYYITGLREEDYTDLWEKEFLKEKLPILVQSFGEEVKDPFNVTLWKTRKLRIVDEITMLDLNDPDHLLTYFNIKGGGFPYIAKSPDELSKKNSRFYLEEPHLNYEVNEDNDKVKDKAISMLSDIDSGGHGYATMFFLHKNLITTQEGITYNTPKDIIYRALRRFINGDYNTTGKKKSAKQFIDAVDMYKKDNKRSRVTGIVNDAIFYGLISTNKDNYFVSEITKHNFKTSDKNKMIEDLMKPSLQDEVVGLLNEVQLKWNKY